MTGSVGKRLSLAIGFLPALFLAGCGLLAGCGGGGSTVAPSAKSKIAFASGPSARAEIYVMNADGSGRRRLTRNPADDGAPRWSPDGRRIAFSSDRDDKGLLAPRNFEIYVMNADGSGQQRLTRNGAVDLALSWSPDGQRINIARIRGDHATVYVMNADGSGQQRLKALDDKPLSTWSPDGGRIAYVGGPDGVEIYVMNADGSGQRRLTRNGAVDLAPAWSPDGRSITFTSARGPFGTTEVYVVNADGSGERRLTRNSVEDGFSAWSPDGRKIVFMSRRDSNYEIYVMNADGSSQRRLTRNPEPDGDPAWQPAPTSPS